MEPLLYSVILQDVQDSLLLQRNFRGRSYVVDCLLHEKAVEWWSFLQVVAEVVKILEIEQERWVAFPYEEIVVKHLVTTLAMDDVITEAVSNVRSCRKFPGIPATFYFNAL